MTNAYNDQCKHEMKYLNIIMNNATKMLVSEGDAKMIECCIKENIKTPVMSGSLSLYNCSVSEDQFKDSNINTQSIGTTTFFNQLSFISPGICENNFAKTTKFLLKRFYISSFFVTNDVLLIFINLILTSF